MVWGKLRGRDLPVAQCTTWQRDWQCKAEPQNSNADQSMKLDLSCQRCRRVSVHAQSGELPSQMAEPADDCGLSGPQFMKQLVGVQTSSILARKFLQ